MKTSNNHSTRIVIMFWSMPSCSMLKTYKIKSDMLNQALKFEKSVEVITTNDQILKLRKIGIEAGKFVGLKSIKGNMKKMLLNINDIKRVILL